MYAVEMDKPYSTINESEVLRRIKSYDCKFIEFTGGEPLIHKGVDKLMSALCDEGYEVAVETNGATDISNLDHRIIKIMDVKCPASGMHEKTIFANFRALNYKDEIKFVVANREDMLYAQDIITEFKLNEVCKEIIISPVLGKIELKEMAAFILSNNLNVRMQIQMHKTIWGDDAVGV
jgi:7-carboxy-7-deazaguanine synthase